MRAAPWAHAHGCQLSLKLRSCQLALKLRDCQLSLKLRDCQLSLKLRIRVKPAVTGKQPRKGK